MRVLGIVLSGAVIFGPESGPLAFSTLLDLVSLEEAAGFVALPQHLLLAVPHAVGVEPIFSIQVVDC
jgi:hypothetical protein